MASYIIISQDPENDALQHINHWAKSCGLTEVCPDVKLIGWDFPFISQEQQNRFGMHGYVAACVIPDDFGQITRRDHFRKQGSRLCRDNYQRALYSAI